MPVSVKDNKTNVIKENERNTRRQRCWEDDVEGRKI